MGRAKHIRLFVRAALLLAQAGLLAGCFQPLYGSASLNGRPAVREALSGVDVSEIPAAANSAEARLAVQVRNELIYSFTGGGHASSPTHRLKVALSGTHTVVGVIPETGLPNSENYGLNATYSLTELATGKVVVTGAATTNVSFSTLGQQRFARVSSMHDAERRAAQVISENITTRLASYFISGT
jgi:LPS-assembly lipoprotein